MSPSAPSGLPPAWAAVLDAVDPRVAGPLRGALASGGPPPREDRERLARAPLVVLVGHRAAGKSRLLPLLGPLLGRPTLDLDAEIARRHARSIGAWVSADLPGFRRAEAEAFRALAPGHLVAVGGGFLSTHPGLLAGHLAVEVPVSFQTYRERLLVDDSRPRLHPGQPLESEITEVYRARERAHAEVATWSLARLLRAAGAGGGP